MKTAEQKFGTLLKHFLNLRPCNGTPVFGHWQEKDTQVQQEHVNTLENKNSFKNFGKATGFPRQHKK